MTNKIANIQKIKSYLRKQADYLEQANDLRNQAISGAQDYAVQGADFVQENPGKAAAGLGAGIAGLYGLGKLRSAMAPSSQSAPPGMFSNLSAPVKLGLGAGAAGLGYLAYRNMFGDGNKRKITIST